MRKHHVSREEPMGPVTGLLNLVEFIISGLQALLAALPIPL